MSKWYVVSEEELKRYKSALENVGAAYEMGTRHDVENAEEYLAEAEAACRAREVEPEFSDSKVALLWVEVVR